MLFVVFITLAVLVTGTSFLLTCHFWEHRRFARGSFRVDREPHFVGRVGLIVPCKGVDIKLKENLACLFDQSYDDYEIYFVVEQQNDPACKVIRKLIHEESRTAAHLIVSGLTQEHGQKIHNLLCGYQALSPEVKTIVFADCDVAPDRDWLSRLVAPLDKVNVHAVSSYRWFMPQKDTFANFLLASINAAAMGLVCSRRQAVIWGGSWAVSRRTFNGAEIPQRWQSYISDDLVATSRFNRLRLNIHFEPRCVVKSPVDYSFVGMWEFLRRQCFMGRRYLPKRWIAGVAYTSLSMLAFWGGLLGGAALAVSGRPVAGSLGLATAGVLWILSALRARWRQDASRLYVRDETLGLKRARWFDICGYPLTLTTLWCGLVSVAVARCIRWRGIAYHLSRKGAVLRVEREYTPEKVQGPLLIASTANLPQREPIPAEFPRLALYSDEASTDAEHPVDRRRIA